jgi:glycosyltransferase involved in cell wall biosynthesis
MKVLYISVFHPELHRGGAQQVAYELFLAMKSQPEVEPYFLASTDPAQKAFYKPGARITGFDGRANEFLFLPDGYDHWWHKVSNPALLERFAEFLRTLQPDVVHFHHFMLLGLDLLTLTRQVLPQAKIVLTFHEFLAICAADGQMVRRLDGTLCDRASPARCHQCFPERGPEQFFMRDLWTRRHLDAVDAFTVPSRFMLDVYRGWGIAPDRLHHVPNGQPDYSKGDLRLGERAKRNRFGFFGQFVDNKGIWVLLQAVSLLRASGFTDFTVDINGDNLRHASEARRQEFEAFRTAEEARPAEQQNVIFRGAYHVDQIGSRMALVDWCVVPSTWWEIFGLVISEAWMFRRPVIASNVGGPAERIRHGVDGLLFERADPRSLAATLRRAASTPALWKTLHTGIRAPISGEEMARLTRSVYDRLGLAETGTSPATGPHIVAREKKVT